MTKTVFEKENVRPRIDDRMVLTDRINLSELTRWNRHFFCSTSIAYLKKEIAFSVTNLAFHGRKVTQNTFLFWRTSVDNACEATSISMRPWWIHSAGQQQAQLQHFQQHVPQQVPVLPQTSSSWADWSNLCDTTAADGILAITSSHVWIALLTMYSSLRNAPSMVMI